MSLELQESISSFVDDELDASMCDELLSHFEKNESQKLRVARYALIGSAMRRDLSQTVEFSLLDRIQADLASEPPLKNEAELTLPQNAEAGVVVLPLSPRNSPQNSAQKRSRFRPAMGFGIAATVTLVAVLGFQMFTSSVDVPQRVFVANNAMPATQTIQITKQFSPPASSAVVLANVTDELPTISESKTFAEQSLIDDGQWTRITQAADTPVQAHFFSRYEKGHVPFVFQPKHFSFARSVNLESGGSE